MRRGRAGGAILLWVLAVVGALVGLIDMALSATAREALVNSGRTERTQAFYLAEAGRNRALTSLARGNAWNHEGVWFPFGGGEYRVCAVKQTVAPLEDRWTLTCSGRVGGGGGTVTETEMETVTVVWQVLVTRQDETLIEKLEPLVDTWRQL